MESLDAVEYATLEWVDWYNSRRLLELIGNIPPAEAEAVYFASLKQTAIAAELKPNSPRGYRGGSYPSHPKSTMFCNIVSARLPALSRKDIHPSFQPTSASRRAVKLEPITGSKISALRRGVDNAVIKTLQTFCALQDVFRR